MCAGVCSYMWVDNDTIGALVIPPERGAPPEKPPVPIGPNIQDNTSGKTSQVGRGKPICHQLGYSSNALRLHRLVTATPIFSGTLIRSCTLCGGLTHS